MKLKQELTERITNINIKDGTIYFIPDLWRCFPFRKERASFLLMHIVTLSIGLKNKHNNGWIELSDKYMAGRMQVSIPTISRWIRLLKELDFIKSKCKGSKNRRYVKPNIAAIQKILDNLKPI